MRNRRPDLLSRFQQPALSLCIKYRFRLSAGLHQRAGTHTDLPGQLYLLSERRQRLRALSLLDPLKYHRADHGGSGRYLQHHRRSYLLSEKQYLGAGAVPDPNRRNKQGNGRLRKLYQYQYDLLLYLFSGFPRRGKPVPGRKRRRLNGRKVHSLNNIGILKLRQHGSYRFIENRVP